MFVMDVGKAAKQPFDLSPWDFAEYQVQGFDETVKFSLQLFSAHLFWTCLNTIPSIIKSWWSLSKNRQLNLALEKYTQKFFSPLLINKSMQAVFAADKSLFESVTVKRANNELSVSYSIEECTLEMIIRVPNTFPLSAVEVESGPGGRSGVTEARWRSWLLSAAAVIVAQNASLVEAVIIFHKNIALHFEGVEDCAICYSIISVIDRSVPSKLCKTCKHLFHGSCLYKWFRTSNNSLCPLCRSIF